MTNNFIWCAYCNLGKRDLIGTKAEADYYKVLDIIDNKFKYCCSYRCARMLFPKHSSIHIADFFYTVSQRKNRIYFQDLIGQ